MNGLKFLFCFFLLFSVTKTASAEPWFEYKSENFTVFSNDDRKKVEALVLDLEYFRYFLQIFTNIKDTQAIRPLLVYAYDDGRSFAQDTNYSYAILGYFQRNVHGTVAFANLQDADREFTLGGREVLFHEYVHYFMNQFSKFRYPRWYDEGFADYLATFTREGTKVSIGKVIMDRVETLRNTPWLSLEILLASNDTIETPDHMNAGFYTFYAEAWLFVHYLHTKPERKQQLLNYLSAINDGVPYKQAVEENFKTDLQSLYKELVDYWEEKRIPFTVYDFEKVDFSPKVKVRRLNDREIVLVRTRAKTYGLPRRIKASEIRKDLNKFLKDHPGDMEAKILLAEAVLLHGKDKEKAEALRALEEVLAANPSHPKANAVKAMALFEEARENYDQISEEVLTRAREHLKISLENDPGDAFSIYYLGAVELHHPNPKLQNAVDALLEGLSLYPQNIPLEYEFAFLLARANLLEEAFNQFSSLSKIAYSQKLRDFAAACAQQIEDPETQFSCTFQDFEALEKND